MLRLLILLTVVAVGLVTALSVSNQLAGGAARAATAGAGGSFPDWRSLALGLVIGFAVAWVRQFPWRLLPFLLSEWTREWRRRAMLACLGVVFACVLLVY